MTVKRVVGLILWFAVFCVARSDTVRLKGGALIKGRVLTVNPKATVVDIGFDLLKIPADSILRVDSDGEAATAVEDDGELYKVGGAGLATIIDAVEKYAPAVLLVRTPKGLGSGFFVNRDGYLITNFHVVRGQRHVSVTQFHRDGREMRKIIYRDVRIAALDPFHDLAVLKVEDGLEDNFTPVVFAPEEDVKLGEGVFVIGNPLGLERTVTEGVVSQVNRNFDGNLYLQIDAPVNPGNSGGPLFDSRGRVIGVVNMGVLVMEGLNFAIPARRVKFLLNHLEAYAFDESNPLSGNFYPDAPRKPRPAPGDKQGDEL